MPSSRVRAIVTLLLSLAVCGSAAAEEVAKRLRLSLSVGAFESGDEISSQSANVLSVLNEEGELQFRFEDPRSDATVSSDLKIQSGPIATLALQYAVNRIFVLEGSAGYNRNDVGEIEVHPIRSDVVRFSAGELTRVPIQLTFLARFRPDKRFNPYVGGGFGYTLIGFDPSDELDQFSLNMDGSFYKQARLLPDDRGSVIQIDPSQELQPMGPVTIEADDAWEWHVAGGVEFGLGSRWALFLDLRYSESSRDFRIQYSGQDNIGVGVPQGKTEIGSEIATTTYGPWLVFPGGLLDLDGDGFVDSALYYAQGGTLKYDGLATQFGVRFTF